MVGEGGVNNGSRCVGVTVHTACSVRDPWEWPDPEPGALISLDSPKDLTPHLHQQNHKTLVTLLLKSLTGGDEGLMKSQVESEFYILDISRVNSTCESNVSNNIE